MNCPLCGDGPWQLAAGLLDHLAEWHGVAHPMYHTHSPLVFCFCGQNWADEPVLAHWERRGGLPAHLAEFLLGVAPEGQG